MASEQAILGIGLIAVGFLWYSNELVKRGSDMWGKAFQIISFLFILVDLTIMGQIFRTEALFQMEDLVVGAPFWIVTTLIWVLTGLWVFGFAFGLLEGLRKPKMEKVDRIGGRFGSQ